VLIRPNGVFDDPYIFQAEAIFEERSLRFMIIIQLFNAKLMDIEVVIFEKVVGNQKLLYLFFLFVVLWEIGGVFAFLLIKGGGVAADEQKQLVLEFIGSAGADSRVKETEFSEVKVGYFEAIPDIPFLIFLGEDDDGMQIRDKSHELPSDATPEDRIDLCIYLQVILYFVPISDACKINLVLLHKNPFLLLYCKGVYQAQMPSVVDYVDLFCYLAFEVYVVDLA
jgi:hypothetical protein